MLTMLLGIWAIILTVRSEPGQEFSAKLFHGSEVFFEGMSDCAGYYIQSSGHWQKGYDLFARKGSGRISDSKMILQKCHNDGQCIRHGECVRIQVGAGQTSAGNYWLTTSYAGNGYNVGTERLGSVSGCCDSFQWEMNHQNNHDGCIEHGQEIYIKNQHGNYQSKPYVQCNGWKESNLHYLTTWSSRDTMSIFKVHMWNTGVTPQAICKYIVDVAQEKDGEPLNRVEIRGETVKIEWDIWDWGMDPSTEVTFVDDKELLNSARCPDNSACGVTYTKTVSQTESFTIGAGAGISMSATVGASAGIPGIGSIDASFTVGSEYHIDLETSSTAGFENSVSQDGTCIARPYPTLCMIYGTSITFDTKGTVSPKFMIDLNVDDADMNLEPIHCGGPESDWDYQTTVIWKAVSTKGIEALETPICDDQISFGCEDHVTTQTCWKCDDPGVFFNCARSCTDKCGIGSPVCEGGPSCNFQPVEPNHCPADSILNGNPPLPKCKTVYNQQNAVCEAVEHFRPGGGPDEYAVHNCITKEGDKHNIFAWECDFGEQTQWMEKKRARLGRKMTDPNWNPEVSPYYGFPKDMFQFHHRAVPLKQIPAKARLGIENARLRKANRALMEALKSLN